MDEVDGIILHTLRALGCEFGADIRSLSQFSTELIVEAVALCVRVIRSDLDAPHRLPPSMSARFRIGTSLANAVKEIGYTGEAGYQTFLYSNESDIRKVFIFLLEKMPKDTSAGGDGEAAGASALLQNAIADEVRKRLSSPWTPAYCKRRGVCWRGDPPTWQRQGSAGVTPFTAGPLHIPTGLHDVTAGNPHPRERLAYWASDSLPLVTGQPQCRDTLTQAVMEHNAIRYSSEQDWDAEWSQQGLLSRLSPTEYRARKRDKLRNKFASHIQESLKKTGAPAEGLSVAVSRDEGKTKRSRFSHIEKLQYAQDQDSVNAQVEEVSKEATEEELQRQREEELARLQQDLEEVAARLGQQELGVRGYSGGQQQMDDRIATLEKQNETNKESFKVKKRTMDLLPDAENNLSTLQSLVDASAERLVTLATQWEAHRAPLIANYRQMKALTEDHESRTALRLEEIRRLRGRMREVAADARAKEETYKQLAAEYERVGKSDVNRASYTKRILEIVGNIKKQKQDIDKVLVDTKCIQKEINQLTGKLDRTFTVTDELIFKDAKRDETVRKAYKFLAALHENCNAVINTVEDTGVILREIRDLEDQIEQESKSKVMDNLEKISGDYREMKKENSVLLAKFKKLQSGNS